MTRSTAEANLRPEQVSWRVQCADGVRVGRRAQTSCHTWYIRTVSTPRASQNFWTPLALKPNRRKDALRVKERTHSAVGARRVKTNPNKTLICEYSIWPQTWNACCSGRTWKVGRPLRPLLVSFLPGLTSWKNRHRSAQSPDQNRHNAQPFV